ncbi:hypothetical protein [Allosalinactinospora lopnorensis]|uniref:hypothetical protein n=1 Tax=Allosalinactinospora lopnorensis TaxID=1352348 RepID=UPI000623E571|nr:hypothetical protein [Allosalinactinospora lopnorensis]
MDDDNVSRTGPGTGADPWAKREAAQTDVDDPTIPFLGSPVQITGYLREDLRTVLNEARFTVEEEDALSYVPATTQARPEIQVFLICGRGG